MRDDRQVTTFPIWRFTAAVSACVLSMSACRHTKPRGPSPRAHGPRADDRVAFTQKAPEVGLVVVVRFSGRHKRYHPRIKLDEGRFDKEFRAEVLATHGGFVTKAKITYRRISASIWPGFDVPIRIMGSQKEQFLGKTFFVNRGDGKFLVTEESKRKAPNTVGYLVTLDIANWVAPTVAGLSKGRFRIGDRMPSVERSFERLFQQSEAALPRWRRGRRTHKVIGATLKEVTLVGSIPVAIIEVKEEERQTDKARVQLTTLLKVRLLDSRLVSYRSIETLRRGNQLVFETSKKVSMTYSRTSSGNL